MLTGFFDFLKGFRRSSQKTKQLFFSLTILVSVFFILFSFSFSLRSGMIGILVPDGDNLTLGEQGIIKAEAFFKSVFQGGNLILKNVSGFFYSERFVNMLRSVFGGPRIEVLEPGPEINLPQAEPNF